MKLSEVCIKRPVLAWVFTFILVLVGVVCFFRLSVQQYPKAYSERPYITVETQLRGAGPEIIENQITVPVEEALAGIEGIDTMMSSSESETSKVTLEFSPDRPIDSAVNDVRDRLTSLSGNSALPPEATQPSIQKSRADERPIMAIALTSKTKDRGELYDIATRDIQKTFEALPGVARVQVVGASNYEMKIYLDPKKLHAYDLTVSEVVQAIEKHNVEKPAGKLMSKTREFVVTVVANLEKAEEFELLVIQSRNDRLIRLKDVGRVEMTSDDLRTRTRFNGEGAVGVQIVKQSNTNPIEVAKVVREEMEKIKKILPKEVSFDIAYNPTIYIERSIQEVYKTLIEAVFLVILVVFFFLRSARASLIPLVTIPVSLIGTFFLMYLCGFSINTYTLMALVLAIGLVVDDAIVVLENVYKYLEKGHRPFDAAVKGIREISFSVIAMTLTLAAVYAPVALAKGVTGKMLMEFSVTLAGSVLISGFVALTLSPMMCARLLGGEEKRIGIRNLWYRLKDKVPTEHWLSQFESFYEDKLRQILTLRGKVCGAAFLIACAGATVFSFLPAELEPPEDKGYIEINGSGPQTANREYVDYYLKKMNEAILKVAEVESVISNIITPTYDVSIQLVDKTKRNRPTKEVMKELSDKFRAITGIEVTTMYEGGGTSLGDSSMIQLVIRANKSHKELQNLVKEFTSAVFRSGIARGITSGVHSTDAEDYVINILRDKAASLNIEPSVIAETVAILMGGQKAKKFKRDNKLYDVRVCVEEGGKQTTEDIVNLFVKSGGDRVGRKEQRLVQLSELVSIYARSGPKQIQHHNRMRSIGMNVMLKGSTNLDEGIKKLDQIKTEILPQDVRFDYVDSTKRFLTESNTMVFIFLLALSFIYLVMAAQFESWRDPLIIMLTVPLSISGGLFVLGLLPAGTINLYSNIGFVTLIGLITKHGILMVDFANLLRREGVEINDAIIRASRQRLRPILMTTFAIILGALPMAFANGAGCESRQQLGWVIVGGMGLGTIFTLFVIPTMYTLLTTKRMKEVS